MFDSEHVVASKTRVLCTHLGVGVHQAVQFELRGFVFGVNMSHGVSDSLTNGQQQPDGHQLDTRTNG